jgi:hypothetical protein
MNTETSTTTTDPAQTTRWHLHQGTVQWFIVGPGPSVWLACSAPDYASRKPTIQPDESALARAAIALLEIRHPQDNSAGVEEIKKALADAAAGVKPVRSKPTTVSFVPSKPAKSEHIVIDADEVQRIKQAVSEVTGVSIALIDASNNHDSATVRSANAKLMFCGAVLARWPQATRNLIASAIGRSQSTLSYYSRNHTYNNESFTDYARKFRRICEQLGLEPATR